MGCTYSKPGLRVLAPPTVRFLLEDRERAKLYYPSCDLRSDSPLATTYRIYAAIVLRDEEKLRKEIQHFWKQHKWKVANMQDPKDPDTERYTVVSVIPYLLVEAFNRPIALGLARDGSSVTPDYGEKRLNARDKQYESVPEWAKRVAPLPETLVIPDGQEHVPAGLDDTTADQRMLTKNILTKHLHIFFIDISVDKA